MHRDGVELFDPILRFMTEARKVTQRARLRKIGARRSTGAAMSPGRRAGLGGTRARHTRRVYNICYRFTGNATDAQDLSQEVFLRIYRTLPVTGRRMERFPRGSRA